MFITVILTQIHMDRQVYDASAEYHYLILRRIYEVFFSIDDDE